MITLPKGCSCSELTVNPKNWNQKGASTKKDWYIQYYFHDPAFKNDPKLKYGKLCIVKGGINRLKSLAERREAIKLLLENELNAVLKTEGYNPITKSKMVTESENDPGLSLSLMQGLNYALNKIVCADCTKKDMRSVVKYFSEAAQHVHLNETEIREIKRKHVKLILEKCAELKPKWTANTFNFYRAYLMMMFKELVEMEVIEVNPVKEISKMKKLIRLRKVLTSEERKKVDQYLQPAYPVFYNFLQIFFHSGARLTELTQLKGRDINLKEQYFKPVIKKGKEYREVKKTIKDVALPYWVNAVVDCKKEDFVFSVGLKPGRRAIRPEQITRRWRRHVKKQLGIEADFYSLKHSNTDETAALIGLQDASAHNSHTSTVITMKHYAIGEKEREHERLKKVNNTFG